MLEIRLVVASEYYGVKAMVGILNNNYNNP
jgi:hypothetical protein